MNELITKVFVKQPLALPGSANYSVSLVSSLQRDHLLSFQLIPVFNFPNGWNSGEKFFLELIYCLNLRSLGRHP